MAHPQGNGHARLAVLVCALCAMPVLTHAADMGSPPKPGGVLKAPADPGMKTPVDPGAVVEPPRTGNEEIVRRPKKVDPKIDDATPDIDRKNRKKAEEKKERK